MLKDIKFDERGLIPAIAQDAETGDVLMLAYMNAESLAKTLETGLAHYFSRSRQELWLKGATSGNLQYVRKIRYDCDGDALLLSVGQTGAACHTGNRSCFFRALEGGAATTEPPSGLGVLTALYSLISDRRARPKEGSYTNYLFEKGIDKILKKVGEESAEVIIASKNGAKDEIIYEMCDLIYHLSVLMIQTGVGWPELIGELSARYNK